MKHVELNELVFDRMSGYVKVCILAVRRNDCVLSQYSSIKHESSRI
jgi:hypothetical protein